MLCLYGMQRLMEKVLTSYPCIPRFRNWPFMCRAHCPIPGTGFASVGMCTVPELMYRIASLAAAVSFLCQTCIPNPSPS